MNRAQPPWRLASADTLALLARWALGGLFIYMGLTKAVVHYPYDFLKMVGQYGVVTNHYLLNSIAAALPWFEEFCGLLLLAGIAVRGSALLLVAMLLPFTVLIFRHGLELAAALHQPFCAIKFDCGCGNGEVFVCHKLPENCLLLLLAGWLTVRRTGRLCARFSLFESASPLVAPPEASSVAQTSSLP